EPALADNKFRPGVGDLIADRNPDAYAPLLLPNDQLPLLTNPPRQQVGELRVATAQVNAAHGKDVATLRGMDLIEEAADGGAKIIVLSELFPFPPGAVAADPEAAAHASQDIAAHIAMLAAQYDVLIATSLVEKGHHGQYHHTAYLWSKDGLIGSYRQVHIRAGDRGWATPGTEFRAFDTPLGRIGLMVGHDGLFVESARILALLGADLILYPTTWTLDWEPELAMLERSAENRVSILAAARVDSPVRRGSVIAHIPEFSELRRYHGRLSPSFTTEAPAATEIVLFQTINPTASRNKLVSPATDVILNRRAELYAPLTRPARPTIPA
ncbi:MAG: carbon-nitrogen hydrolase family protein, partial [Dehalococcoidia bacterium]|nr:carbon-nitrogen hydrolase family protein [Dehalococcoidia bacterium]